MYQQNLKRPLLSLADLSNEDIVKLGDIAFDFGQSPKRFKDRLHGARVGLLFTAPSTRTRASFWSAALTLGCEVLSLGPTELQLSTGETWGDTGMVLSNFLDGTVIRTNGPQKDMVELAACLPATINALSSEEHPTQAIADLCAMREHFETIDQLRVAYFGEVNNTARALAWLVCKLPFASFDVYAPSGSGFPPEEIQHWNSLRSGEFVRQYDSMPDSPEPVDIVYTTRWQSMGKPRLEPDWQTRFAPFAVTQELIKRFSGAKNAVFMHDLPAVRGQEVDAEVLDADCRSSLVRRQVHHKASAAASALIWSMGQF